MPPAWTLMPLVVFAVLASSVSQIVVGAEFRTDERPTVKADETIDDDLYIFGDDITIDGTVNGDVIAFGRLITLNGTVEGDLITAGQAIVINGKVGDDVRMAGQVLKIDDDASIADDVIAAGFSLEFTQGSSIGGDLAYAGYQAQLAGDIDGKVNGRMANCEIGGTIGGDVQLSVAGDRVGTRSYLYGSPPPVSFPDVPPGLTIRETAKIDGELTYESPREAEIAQGSQITGKLTHNQPHVQAKKPLTPTEQAVRKYSRFAVLAIVGLGVVLIAPTWTRQVSSNIKSRPLISLGLGIVAIIGFAGLLFVIVVSVIVVAIIASAIQLSGLVPVVIVLGLASFVMLAVGFWFFTVYLAEIILSYFAGSWLLGLAKPSLGANRFLSLFLGLVLLAAICSVPYAEPVVGWLAVLLGLGALMVWFFWRSPSAAASTEAKA